MNNEPEVIDDIEIDSDISDNEPEPMNEGHASAGDESPEPEDALGDSRLGHDLGQLISEIRRDEEDFQQSGDTADGDPEPDPFDPSQFSLDTTVNAPAGRPEDAPEADNQEEEGIFESASETETADSASAEVDDLDSASAEGAAGTDRESDEAASAIAQLVSEIETALQRFTQAERDRADQLIAEREAQVAEQYRRVRSLADKIAKQKAQIQEAKNELKAKLELADRLHIEFDSIRQVLNGKLGALDKLEKEDEAAE